MLLETIHIRFAVFRLSTLSRLSLPFRLTTGKLLMVLLDTHVWVWWVHGDPRLPKQIRELVDGEEHNGLGVSIISCWEVAMLNARRRILLAMPCLNWMQAATATRGVQLLQISLEIAVDAASLPGAFHRDPADQIIVATARVHDIPLVTLDGRIRHYAHVKLAP
jgi:PIN domain nuclease of toxin-antitoxin system